MPELIISEPKSNRILRNVFHHPTSSMEHDIHIEYRIYGNHKKTSAWLWLTMKIVQWSFILIFLITISPWPESAVFHDAFNGRAKMAVSLLRFTLIVLPPLLDGLSSQFAIIQYP